MITSKEKDKLKLDWKLNIKAPYLPCLDCKDMRNINYAQPCYTPNACRKWLDWSNSNMNEEVFRYVTKK